MRGAFVYSTPPTVYGGPPTLRAFVDPNTIIELRRIENNPQALAGLLQGLAARLDAITRPTPGLTLNDLVEVPGTNRTLYRVAGPGRGVQGFTRWVRPGTQGLANVIAAIQAALSQRAAA